ncbi:MAG: hypothetical protein ACTSR8_17920 [Promethearchaeota archaeon]
MENIKEKKDKNLLKDEKIIYRVTFKRFNRVTLLTGLFFFTFVILNIPFLYNPELGAITTDLIGKPTMGPGAAIRAYIWLGIIPLFLGLCFILFSYLSSRTIILDMYENGKGRYIKKGITNFLLDTQVDFNLKDNLQQISLGKRHQRFVIWVPIAILIFIIYMLIDYINFLDVTFDITFMFFDLELSLKIILLINIFLMISIMIPYTLFPRKLCRIDTAEEFIQFDYSTLEVKKLSESAKALHYINAFKLLNMEERKGGEYIPKESELPEKYPDILKDKINNRNFKHLPLFPIIMNFSFLSLIILPLFIPNYFLGGFTFKIEYFLSIAIFFLIVQTLQNLWFSEQKIFYEKNQNNLLVFRNNPLLGGSVNYFYNIDTIEHQFITRKPHFLEYTIFFFPIVQIIWIFFYMTIFIEYFFIENYYTILYIAVMIGIFYFTASEYVFPRSALNFTPANQRERNKKTEKFLLFFPAEELLKAPPFKEALKTKNGIKPMFRGMLIIILPVIFGLLWVILSFYSQVPGIYDTIF